MDDEDVITGILRALSSARTAAAGGPQSGLRKVREAWPGGSGPPAAAMSAEAALGPDGAGDQA